MLDKTTREDFSHIQQAHTLEENGLIPESVWNSDLLLLYTGRDAFDSSIGICLRRVYLSILSGSPGKILWGFFLELLTSA